MGSIWDWSSTASENATADNGLTFAEGQAPSTVNDSCRTVLKRVADLLKDLGGIAEVGGTANAITMTSYNSFSDYRDGLIVTFRAGSTNTDETTINVNTVGVKPIVKFDVGGETDLVGGEIIANGIYGLVYSEALNASAGAWLLVNPSPVHVQGTKTDDPVDADEFLIYDSEDSSKAKKLTWASIKATLKAYFDPIYAPISLASSALLKSGGTMTGDLVLKGNPTSNLMAATKQYADTGDAKQIGVGQTWQDLTASRTFNVVYTNNTGRPIMISMCHNSDRSGWFYVSPNGSTWITVGTTRISGDGSPVTIIVPAGWRYKTDGGVNNWAELR